VKRALLEIAVAAASLAAGTWALIALRADAPESLLAILALVVALAFWARPAVALTTALAAAVLVDVYFLPPYGFMLPALDGYLTMVAFALAAGLSTRAATVQRSQTRQRDALIAQLRQSESALERRVVERTEALSAAEERLRLAARAANDALWDCDIEKGVVWWGDAFRTDFGHTSTHPTFDEWIACVHPEDRDRIMNDVMRLLDSAADTWRAEYRFRRGDGSHAWVLNRGHVVRDPSGRPIRMIGAMMDITERKEAERLKSDFVSFVSHQLRTPLAGMSWMLELAADSGGLSTDASEYIAEARESAKRLVGLVNDLLDIARLESGRAPAVPERVPLEELTASVLREIQTLVDEKQHTVTVDVAGGAVAWADAQMVRQVVANLLSNAVKYTPNGGRIGVAMHTRGDTVQWSVTDTGVGIPRASQGRLFERFYRADNAMAMEVEGTGLGLHLVRLIVEQAGGHVWCESEEGHGAVFSFTLPAAQEGVAGHDTSTARAAG
jgi:PAS domain S-box-containing protein